MSLGPRFEKHTNVLSYC